MTSNAYIIIGYITLAFSLLFAVFAVILLVRYNIMRIIGDVSGSSEKKGIQRIRDNSANSAGYNNGSFYNRSYTGKIGHSETLTGFTEERREVAEQTTVLGTTGYVSDAFDTTSEETTLLSQNTDSNQTTVLVGRDASFPAFSNQESNNLLDEFGIQVEDEIVLVHSDEEI